MAGKRDIVFDALDGGIPERIPTGFWHHFAPDDAENYFNDWSEEGIKHNIEGHVQYYKDADPDLIKVMTDGFFGYPNDYLRGLKNLTDIGDTPAADAKEWIDAQVYLVQQLRERIGKNVAYFYNVCSPAAYLCYVFEDYNQRFDVTKAIKENPEGTKKALLRIAEDIALLSDRILDEGKADGIYLNVQTYDGITEEEYIEYIRPSELLLLERAGRKSRYNILHICGYGGQKNHLELYTDYPVSAFNWATGVEHVSLAEGKKLFKGKAVLGGFDNTKDGILYRGDKNDIEAETEKILKETGLAGVILGADCTVPIDTPESHFHWVRDKAAEIAS